MKFKVFFLSLFFCFTCFSIKALEWKELKGEHFIIYVLKEDAFSQEALRRAEKYYQDIAHYLGYARYSNFWTWDNRVKIYIYPDKKSYLKYSGQPQWSEGMANYTNKQILTYRGAKSFLDSILPHEITHLLFRDFIGFESKVPLWLDEGVAQWAQEKDRRKIMEFMKQSFDKGIVLSFKDMMNIDVNKINSIDSIHIRYALQKEPTLMFLSGDNLVKLFYLQSASLVGFLIERHGNSRFTDFCRYLKRGEPLDSSLRKAYPKLITDLDQLQSLWISYMENYKGMNRRWRK
ncbi:MAG: hypothetical protein DRP69_06060 [Candidatus Duberdicusella sinuisediminis]|nr:MAG: hypothetical protein DRP69_06060 [Candidatus Omnitrophota bacterium]